MLVAAVVPNALVPRACDMPGARWRYLRPLRVRRRPRSCHSEGVAHLVGAGSLRDASVASHAMPTTTVDTHRVHYLDAGHGTPVVMVHSGGMSSRQWTRLVARLEATHRCVAPDLLGSGNSDPVPGDQPFDFHQDVAVVDAMLDLAGTPAHLVGHSYGGLVALTAARSRPERVLSLSLFEPVVFGVLYSNGDNDAIQNLEAPDRDGTFFDDATGGQEPWMQRFIDYWNGPGAWSALPAASRAQFLRVGRKVFLEVRSLTADRTPHTDYARLAAPTLLMTGEHSTAAARRVCEILASTMPNAFVVHLDGMGHMGPLTHAQAVNDRIVAHIGAANTHPPNDRAD